MVGQHARMEAGLFGSILRIAAGAQGGERVVEKAREELGYVGLKEDHGDQISVNLSYGDQRRLEIARALASEPQAAAARRADRRHEPAGVEASSRSSCAPCATIAVSRSC